jgi:nitrilase
MPRMAPFKAASVQATPVFLDREATIAKACALIAEAARQGARLAVFPEGFVPTYPLWVWYVPAGDSETLGELHNELVSNAVTVPGPEVDALCSAAGEAGINVVIGINELNAEASRGSLFNTLLFIDERGRLLGKHRKLVPTGGERLVHGRGDGSTLEVYDLPIGRLGGLICWESYMPLARYSVYASGAQIYAAPTWDRGEPWLSTLRHVAREGSLYVIGCCSAIRRDDIPDRFAFKARYLRPDKTWINRGDSAIVDPEGRILAGPVREQELILYAEIDLAQVSRSRWELDVAGHYSRPDVFELTVRRRPQRILSSDDKTASADEP